MSVLNRKSYLIRGHRGLLSLSDAYDIMDSHTQDVVGLVQERANFIVHVLRFLIPKKYLPTRIYVYEGDQVLESSLLFTIYRGLSFFHDRIEFQNPEGQLLGWFQSKIFPISGTFSVFNSADEEVGIVHGEWKTWSFKLLDSETQERGKITRKEAGYSIELNEDLQPQETLILLATAFSLDTLF